MHVACNGSNGYWILGLQDEYTGSRVTGRPSQSIVFRFMTSTMPTCASEGVGDTVRSVGYIDSSGPCPGICQYFSATWMGSTRHMMIPGARHIAPWHHGSE